MADSVTIDFSQLDGVAELLSDRNTARATANVMRSTVHAMAAEIGRGARVEAPVNERVLRKSIRWRRVRTDFGTGEFGSDVTIDRRAFYWQFIEFGTDVLEANTFIRRAVDKWIPTAATSLRTNFGNKLEAYLARRARREGINR